MDYILKSNINIIENTGKMKVGSGKLFEEMMMENSSNLKKKT